MVPGGRFNPKYVPQGLLTVAFPASAGFALVTACLSAS